MLMQEIVFVKAKYRREAGYRSDLIYQKNYLLLLMGGLESWYCTKLYVKISILQ
jgi:hypothetical protein